MKYTKIGTTNITIPAICIGTSGAGSRSVATVDSISKRMDVLKYSIDLGFTMIDTADEYEEGHSEEITGKVINGIRDKVFICTKFAARNNSHNGIMNSIEDSLQRLHTDYIDLYQVHWPNPAIPIEETMKTLEEIVKQGKARFIGVCNFNKDEIQEAEQYLNKTTIVSVQSEYNLYNRSIEDELLPFCKRNRKTLLAYSIFNQGKIFLRKRFAFLHILEKKYGKTRYQIILSWILSHAGIVPIVRSMNRENMFANHESLDIILDAKDIDLLNEEFTIKPKFVMPLDIIVPNEDVDDTHRIYTTLNQAVKNEFNIHPSPQKLAEEFLNGKQTRAVELESCSELPGSSGKYKLLHGRVRYWAWIIAFGNKKPIPAYIL